MVSTLTLGVTACNPDAGGVFTESVAVMGGGEIIALQSFDDSKNGGSSDSVRLVHVGKDGVVISDYTDRIREVCGDVSNSAELQSFEQGIVIQDICGEGYSAWMSLDFEISVDMQELDVNVLSFRPSEAGCGVLNVTGVDGSSVDIFDYEWVISSSIILSQNCIQGNLSIDYPSVFSGDEFSVSLKFNPNASGDFITEACFFEIKHKNVICEVLSSVEKNSISKFRESGGAQVIMPYASGGNSEFLGVVSGGPIEYFSFDVCIRAFGLTGSKSIIAVTCDEEVTELLLK